jgi:hypothetical protein
MSRLATPLATLVFILGMLPLALEAQEFDENSKLNTNLGFPFTVPVGTASDVSSLGTGFTTGAGYNFNQHHAFVGEFMWNWLYPTDESLTPLRQALGSSELNGHSNLFVLTGNYRFEVRGHRLGGYFIGGPGLYYRNADLTTNVTPPPGTACSPVWQWWGYRCSSGVVAANSTSSFASAVLGGNAGVGFTIAVGEPRYRLYFEARYHYAPFGNNTSMRFIPITTGIRF